ncbi:UDP-glucose--hexose-1-phosphate uridylyltransferase, partial [Leuconostoc mesenteroides]
MSSNLVKLFVKRIIERTDYTPEDITYLTNQVLGEIGETSCRNCSNRDESISTLQILDQLIEIADKNGTLQNRKINADILGAQLMDYFVPRPSQVRQIFWQHYDHAPREATDYFFDLSKRSNYIKTREISQNLSYPVETEYGQLQITINLSKPEKDPK